MDNEKKLLLLLRKIYRNVFHPKEHFGITAGGFDYINEDASDLIKKSLLSDEPAMICRFGSGELNCVIGYSNIQKGFIKYVEYVTSKIPTFWWDENLFGDAFHHNGLFPTTMNTLQKFSELMIEDMKSVDVLGSWLKQESFFTDELKESVKVKLADLEPYYHVNPWSEALKGKKILVIHPFSESIKNQYKNRELLFEDQRVLPEFELKTIKAVQSIAKSETGFNDWFEALNSMKEQINNTDFDIALIGCGAYGFPLAAHVKRIGKKAVHLGGATQALFGITGKRWEENNVSKYINKYWVRPLPSEMPRNFASIEDGCYW